MNIFLQQMSEWLGYRRVLMVMDQASWHKSNTLVVPDNIKLIYLPPYSPELNPVERLWQYLKDNVLKNRVYDTLDDLEEKVCSFIKGFEPHVIQSVCNVNYMPYYL
jgi:transposase